MPDIEYRGYRFGLKRDRPDHRDFRLFAAPPSLDDVAKTRDIEHYLPDPDKMDQGPTGACVGYSIVQTAKALLYKVRHLDPFDGSPVFMYRQARDLGGYVEEDSGTELRLAWKAFALYGMPRFEELPPNFDRAQLADHNGIFPAGSIWRAMPPQSVFDSALKTQAIQYFRMNSAAEIIHSINDGYPVQYGYAVYSNTFSGRGGQPKYSIGMPQKGDYLVGYHAVTACAYDLTRKVPRIKFRNNWGKTAHEARPNFTLPMEYVDQYKLEIWTPRVVEGGKIMS